MRLSNSLTPYPVLASFRDDYIDASFVTKVDSIQEFGNLRVNVSFLLDEPVLTDLIETNQAEFTVHIESPSTSYRIIERTRDSELSVSLDRQCVSETVEVCTFVTATTAISDFESPFFHPDYGDLAFDIEAGGILAIGNSVSVKVEDEEDIARHASIISVMRASNAQKDALAINTDQSDNILISLRPELYDIYTAYGDGPDFQLVFALVILPALQAVLTRMATVGKEDVDADKEWFKSIEEILERDGLSLDDIDNYSEDKSALAIAQKLLGQPIESSLKSIVKEA